MRYIATLLILLPFLLPAQELQHVYWLELKDKPSTELSINDSTKFLSKQALLRRKKYGLKVDETDIPVSKTYKKELEKRGYSILTESRWLNAVTILSPQKLPLDSFNFPFVKKVKYAGKKKMADEQHAGKKSDLNEMISDLESKFIKDKSKDSTYFGKSHQQLNAIGLPALKAKGLNGSGVRIAVIDAGFRNADRLSCFKQLRSGKQVIETYDLVDNDDDVYNDDDHGVAVLSCIAANKPYEIVGSAPMANYILIRSEDVSTEFPVEEALWIRAVEIADSAGVDIISSSLGYNIFDDHSLDHRKKELDGTSIPISIAASMCAGKGMLLVNSAGNEGENVWRQIAVPADADHILTVGSTDDKGNRAAFSSIGPAADKRVKPDVVSPGENVYVVSASGNLYKGSGTSYSCPMMAGAIACLLQAQPQTDPLSMISAVKLSASNYFAPDAQTGSGIPDLALAYLILKENKTITSDTLLDLRWLADGQLHLTACAAKAQKLSFEILTKEGKLITSGKIKLKESGVFRKAIPKSAKLAAGIYTFRLTLGTGLPEQIIIK